MAVIDIVGMDKTFGQGENRVQALKHINLRMESGDFVAIVGQSGSGKSTLMNILGCLDTPSAGTYHVDGTDTGVLDADGLARLRSEKFGFVFQRYNLLNSLNALNNVALPAVYAGMPQQAREERAKKLLAELGMEEKTKSRPSELSGGQQQRVSIARALMNGGKIILADEPTGALDSQSGAQVMNILMRLNAAGHTVIVVTHDRQIAAFANRTIEIKDGEIVSDVSRKPAAAVEDAAPAPAPRRKLLFLKDQFQEAFSMSVQAIFAHKLRSLLTMLGIIIGIASVVSVVALGQGSQEKILADINSMGTNTIDIVPGYGYGDMRSARVRTLTVADSDVLSEQSYIASSSPTSAASGTLTWHNVSVSARLTGVGEQYLDVKGMEIEEGRPLNRADVLNAATVVIIDGNTRQRLFPDGGDPLGKIVLFNRQPLEIIGVMRDRNSAFGSPDSLELWTPYTTVMHRITGNRSISSITVKIRDEVTPAMAEKNLTHLLTVRHGGETDFYTINMDSIRQTVESATNTMTLLISSIALISLVVGGIGVMNIMLVSVTERTREIGVRMAIGARQYNVLQQFLIEAVVICVIGGALGILLAAAIGLVFAHFVDTFAMAYSSRALAVSLACSSLIGIIFGFMPARNASRLNPVDALARE